MHNPTPLRCSIAAACAIAAMASGTTHAVLVLTEFPVKPGTYGFLATITAIGTLGFLMQLAAGWVLDRLDRMEAKQDAQRVVYLPPAAKNDKGVRYLRTAEPQGAGLTPESIAAARALAKRIVDGPVDVA